MNFIIQCIGFAILWNLVNYKREDKIKLFSKEWFIILFGIVIAITIINDSQKIISFFNS